MDAACKPNRQAAQEQPSAVADGLHTRLDVVGMIPVVGELADGANALLYAAEGDYTNAALSAASMIPLAGNVVGATKLARRALKVVKEARGLKEVKAIRKLKGEAKGLTDAALNLASKPKHSPDIKKWQAKGGKVETMSDGSWKYTNKDGVSVNYKNGYPDFKPHSRQQVDIDVGGNHTIDFIKADKAAPLGPKLSSSTWYLASS